MIHRLQDAEIEHLLSRRDLFAEDSPAHLALVELRELRAQRDRLRSALVEACDIADVAFATDYGFNHEASVQPRARIASLRLAADGSE